MVDESPKSALEKWRKTSKEVYLKSKATAGFDKSYLAKTEFMRQRKKPVYIPTENPFVLAKTNIHDDDYENHGGEVDDNDVDLIDVRTEILSMSHQFQNLLGVIDIGAFGLKKSSETTLLLPTKK